LHELPEALDALTKASQLAASDPHAWRTLGHVYMQLDRPADALQALGQAVALNANDIQSLGDVGTLNAQLTHLPEARAAFDKVLAADPDDADATCGQAYVMRQQGDAKAAEVLEHKVQARGQSCAGWNQRTRAVNVAGDSAEYGVVPAAGR
ncbi:MAG: tetratricopeptide repeat protein, partial [Casimicrobiaceae bacterium]